MVTAGILPRFILLLSSHLCLYLTSGIFSSVFSLTKRYVYFQPFLYALWSRYIDYVTGWTRNRGSIPMRNKTRVSGSSDPTPHPAPLAVSSRSLPYFPTVFCLWDFEQKILRQQVARLSKAPKQRCLLQTGCPGIFLTFWRQNFFLILAHPVYKMWIIQEPNMLELWNKLHSEEKKNGEYKPCLKYSVLYLLNI